MAGCSWCLSWLWAWLAAKYRAPNCKRTWNQPACIESYGRLIELALRALFQVQGGLDVDLPTG